MAKGPVRRSTELSRPLRHYIVAFAVLAIIGSVVLFLSRPEAARSMREVTAERAVAVLTAMLVIALFLERALAVIVDFVVPPATRARAEIVFSPNAVDDALAEVAENDKKQQRFRFVAGYLLALMISLAGVRALAGLFEKSAESQVQGAVPNPFQDGLFAFVDVHVTALLLAGGSAGIAAIIAHLRTRGSLSLRNLKRAGN